MKICFISYRNNNPRIGGIEKITYLLSKEFAVRGHRVFLISQIIADIENAYNPICEELYFPEKEKIDSISNIKFLSDLIEKEEIDFIINQYSTTRGFCTLCQSIRQLHPHIKVITPLHLDPLYKLKELSANFFIKIKNGRSFKKWFTDILLYIKFHTYYKRIIKTEIGRTLEYIEQTSDKIILLSENFITDIKQINKNFQVDKYLAINNPVEFKKYDITGKSNTIIYVGRLEFGLKRFDRMIEIWERIEKKNPEWNLIILGDGGFRKHFEDICRKKNLKRITFKGFKDPIEYYKESEVICLTSSSEGFANVLAESQVYGCLPIAYNSYSALTDIIIDGYNGYTIPSFNKNIFVEKLQAVIDDSDKRRIMQQNAKKHSIKYDIKNIADKWEALFNNI